MVPKTYSLDSIIPMRAPFSFSIPQPSSSAMKSFFLTVPFLLLLSINSSIAYLARDPYVPPNCYLTQCFPKQMPSSQCRRGLVRNSVHPCNNPKQIKEMCCPPRTDEKPRRGK